MFSRSQDAVVIMGVYVNGREREAFSRRDSRLATTLASYFYDLSIHFVEFNLFPDMSAYKGRNAFLDTSSPYAPLPHGTGVSQQRAGLSPAESLKRAKPIRDAIDIHRSAEDTLQNAGFCSPGSVSVTICGFVTGAT